jgi:trans-2,3-dihydro-3-hydroxyanthranilate isomerase
MRFFLVDVFGNTRYSGNQLAVFLDFGTLDAGEMQKIAREINFSETTFITAEEKANGGYPVRIFTPAEEIAFAGHPTLGTAFILCHYIEKDDPDRVILNLKAGQIPVTRQAQLLWMKQNQPHFGSNLDANTVTALLNLEPGDVVDRFPIQEVSTGLPFTIVPLTSMDALKKAKVNPDQYWDFIRTSTAKGFLVFCPEAYEKNHDLSSRVFVDYLGIPEDPATGSATGCLAAYLARYRMFGDGQLEMTIGQGYEIGRPSEIKIKVKRTGEDYDIFVGGRVIEVAEGQWKSEKLKVKNKQ